MPAHSPTAASNSAAGTTLLTIPIRSRLARVDAVAEQQQLVGLLARHVAVDQRHDHERERAHVDLGRAEASRPPSRRSGRTRARCRARRRARARWPRRSSACRARRSAGTGARKRSVPKWRCTSGTSAAKPARLAPEENTFSCEEVSTTQRTAVVVARRLERGDQLAQQLVRERVASVRLVQRDRRDAGRRRRRAESRWPTGHPSRIGRVAESRKFYCLLFRVVS